MKLRKIGQIYHVMFKPGRNKPTKCVSTKTGDRDEAIKIVKMAGIREIEHAAKAGILRTAAMQTILHGNMKMTTTGVLNEYLEWMKGIRRKSEGILRARLFIGAMLRYSGVENYAPMDIKSEHISNYINRPDKTKGSSRMVVLFIIRAFWKWLFANSYTPVNAAALVRVDFDALSHEQKEAKIRLPFTPAEYNRLLSVVDAGKDEFWKFAVRISRSTALRLGDIARLEWATLSNPGEIAVWTKKGNVRVVVEMAGELEKTILLIPSDDPVYMFPAQRWTIADADTRNLLSVQFARICERAGLVGKSFHNLRHTRLTEVVTNGGTIEQAAKIAGHKDVKTTQQFYIHEPDVKDESLEANQL